MKTLNQKIKFSGFFAVLFALLAFSPLKTQAQCSEIVNNLGCSINVLVEVGVTGMNPTTPCHFFRPYSVFIPARSSVQVNCYGMPACSIVVTVSEIGGYAVTPTSIDFSSTNPISTPPTMCAMFGTVNGHFMYYEQTFDRFVFE